MQTLTGPVKIYVEGLTDGRMFVLVSSGSYALYWVIFLVLGVFAYVMVSRALFSRALDSGQKVGMAATMAQVAGLFAAVLCFYLVFFFSPVKLQAWFAEVTLLWIWFIFFLFSYLTAQ